jgi:ferredoxin--NADP+ reductase
LFRIVEKKQVAEQTKKVVIEAPAVASHARAGQFVILRNHERGERYPLTIADFDAEGGTVTLVFLEVGKSTAELGRFNVGDAVPDLVGPLGTPSHIPAGGHVICVAGGVGIAAAHPVAKAMTRGGCTVTSIIGARTHTLLFFENEMRAASTDLIVTTDDGSYGKSGFVTEHLAGLIESRGAKDIAEVFAVGPAVMMKAVAETTRPHGISTVVSLNPIMVDGTGMCGGCRVEVGGETKFACVDGPDFDAHHVDFDLLMARQGTYSEHENQATQQCKLDERIKRDERSAAK